MRGHNALELPRESLMPGRALSSPRRQPSKRMLRVVSDDTTEALLVEHVKKCRVSSTPGELRLKKDLVECDLLREQGIARFDKTVGNPLKCQLTFLCPIGVRGAGATGLASVTAASDAATATTARGVIIPTTFSVLVPKFYPHDPPLLYAERRFSGTCSFVREDGQLQLPFLATGAWSSVSTMAFVVQTLLEGLRGFAAGMAQPWGSVSAKSGGKQYHQEEQERRNASTPEVYFARRPGDRPQKAAQNADKDWNAMHLETDGGGASRACGSAAINSTINSSNVGSALNRGVAGYNEAFDGLTGTGNGAWWTAGREDIKNGEERPCSAGSMDVTDSL